MKTIEEKAVEYAINELPLGYRTLGCKAYIDGAKEALAGQWRKPEDELPKMRERVLLCVKERDCKRPMIGIFKRIPFASDNPDNHGWEWNLGVRKEDVIAWMPIPEPPKDESE